MKATWTFKLVTVDNFPIAPPSALSVPCTYIAYTALNNVYSGFVVRGLIFEKARHCGAFGKNRRGCYVAYYYTVLY